MKRLFYACAVFFAAFLFTDSAAAQATFYVVDATADDENAQDATPGDGTCADSEGRCTLRAAITESYLTSGFVIVFVPGLLEGGEEGTYRVGRTNPADSLGTYEDANQYGDLDIPSGGPGVSFDSLVIRGTGVPGPTIMGMGTDRLFDIQDGVVRIDRIALTGGAARGGEDGAGIDGNNGGAILIGADATVYLDQVSIYENAAGAGGSSPAASDGGNGGDGGGIANFGTLFLRRSFVAENSAGSGGGGLTGNDGGDGGSGGGLFNKGSLLIEESTIYANQAGVPGDGDTAGSGGFGGGIADDTRFNGTGTQLRNTIVAENSAGTDSGNPGPDLYEDFGGAFFLPIASEGNNFIGTNNGVGSSFIAGMPNSNDDYVGTGTGDDATRLDPMLGERSQDSTEVIPNYPLMDGSLAINNGSGVDLDGNEILVDGRGYLRPAPQDGDGAVDIGAYERGSVPVGEQLRINELDAVTAGGAMEFVEIENRGSVDVMVGNYVLAFYQEDALNGGSYSAFDLADDQTNLILAPGEVWVVGDSDVPNVDETPDSFSTSASDIEDAGGAVALFRGNAVDYPSGTAISSFNGSLGDVLVYDTNGGLDERLFCTAFGLLEDDAECAVSGDDEDNSIQLDEDGDEYIIATPTPGTTPTTPPVAVDPGAEAPSAFVLTLPQPNPARGTVSLSVRVPTAQRVEVAVYDVLGRRVALLLESDVAAETAHKLTFDTQELGSGVYVIRAQSDTATLTQRVTVAR